MMSSLEKFILKELDRQRFRSDTIANIMTSLDSDDKKHKFLSFLSENSNVIISINDIFTEINSY